MTQIDPGSLAQVRAQLTAARSVALLTGAGISAESGVPTFRGEPDALWENFRPEQLARMDAFREDPERVWRWYLWRRGIIAQAVPNAGHAALVALAARVERLTVVTQNIDGLHDRAGSDGVLELHGNIWRVRCMGCGLTRNDFRARLDVMPASCRHCNRPVRPDVVWFGEALSTELLDRAFRAACVAEVFLVVGTSGVVQPAASLAAVARENGAFVVEINPEATPLTQVAHVALRGPAGVVLPQIIGLAGPEPTGPTE